MDFSINVQLQPHLTQDGKEQLSMICVYKCPIDNIVSTVVYIRKNGEDVETFINRMKKAIFVDNELTYDIKQNIISKLKVKKRKINKQDELKEVQAAFNNNKRIDLNISISQDELV